MANESSQHSTNEKSQVGDELAAQLSVLESVAQSPGGSPSRIIQAIRTLGSAAIGLGANQVALKAVEVARNVILEFAPNDAVLANEVDMLHRQVRQAFDIGSARRAQATLGNVTALPITTLERAPILSAIHRALSTSGSGGGGPRVAAILAGAGMGKTVTALQYSAAHAADYPGGRFYLSLEADDIATGLARLGSYFGVSAEIAPAATAGIVKAALESPLNDRGEPVASLLVLDNVASAEQWDSIHRTGLVPRGRCRVLIATRAESIPGVEAVRVGRLSHQEARELYERFHSLNAARGGVIQDDPGYVAADAITDLVGGSAVSVAAVAAYMSLRPQITWREYAKTLMSMDTDGSVEVARYAQGASGVTKANQPDPRRSLRIIDDVFEALPRTDRRALEFAAVMPDDSVPSVWLEMLLEADTTLADERGKLSTGDGAGGESSPVRRALTSLDKMGAISPAGEDGKLLAIQPLWRSRIRERLSSQPELVTYLWSGITTCVVARKELIVGKTRDGSERGLNTAAALSDRRLQWELSPMAAVCIELWRKGEPRAAAGIGEWLAVVLAKLGRMTDAANCLLPVWNHEAEIMRGAGPNSLTSCYSNLAMIQKDQGDLPGARKSIERAIAIDQEHFAPDGPDRAGRYSNLAMIQREQGELVAARASMERAIAINQKHLPSDHPTFATHYSNLALILQDQGDLPAARMFMEHAAAIESQHFAPDHPTLAIRHSNLAMILKEQGDLSGAHENMRRAIAIDERHFASDHPTFAIRYSNLAMIQEDLGDLQGARLSMERAVAVAEKHLKSNHPSLATLRSNLAMIQQSQGDMPAAKANVERAIAIDRSNFASDHPVFATRFAMLGMVQYEMGELEAAGVSTQQAIDLLRLHFDEKHPNLAKVYSNLSVIQRDQGNLEGARRSLEQAIAIETEIYHSDHPAFAASFNNLATLEYAVGNTALAREYFKKSLDILLKNFGEEHPNVKTVRRLMQQAGVEG